MSEYMPDQIILSEFKRKGNKIVAVIGWGHDWAAYEGKGTVKHVAEYGNKISQFEAERLFPDIAASGLYYRW